MSGYKYIYATDPTTLIKMGDFVRMRKSAQAGASIKKGFYLVVGHGYYSDFLKCLRTDGVTVQINRNVLELVRN